MSNKTKQYYLNNIKINRIKIKDKSNKKEMYN